MSIIIGITKVWRGLIIFLISKHRWKSRSSFARRARWWHRWPVDDRRGVTSSKPHQEPCSKQPLVGLTRPRTDCYCTNFLYRIRGIRNKWYCNKVKRAINLERTWLKAMSVARLPDCLPARTKVKQAMVTAAGRPGDDAAAPAGALARG